LLYDQNGCKIACMALETAAIAIPQPIKRKRSIKPPAVKNEVVARRSLGQTKTQIARDLGIAVNTVSSIVALSDIDAIMEDGRLGTMKRVPQALKTLDVRLEKNSENAALWLLDKCFEGKDLGSKRMVGDVTLNQTLQVLLRADETPKDEKLNSPIINVIETTPEK
jgi:hypothetical protein